MRKRILNFTAENQSISKRAWRGALKSAVGNALLARKLSAGGAFVSLSQRQPSKATGASQGDVSRLAWATPEQRAAIELGMLPLAKLRGKPPSDAAIAAYVARVGFDRIIDAIAREAAFALFDKLTAPVSTAAE
jgi:hypothetical protein